MTTHNRISVTDDLGDTIVLDASPRRIISLVPSITETLIDLGIGERLVGITNYCVRPKTVVKNIAKVGGTKGFHFDRIEALSPDLILANREENREHHVNELRRSYPVFVTYPRTVEDAMKMVLDLGHLTGAGRRASEIASSCNAILETANPAVTGPRLRTACLIWRDPWMAAGRGTYMNRLLETVGFENVFVETDDRYPETTLEVIRDRKPRVIPLPDEPYVFGEKDEADVEVFFRQHGPVAIERVDGSQLTWFGSRTLLGLHGLLALKTRLLEGLEA